MGRSLDPLGGGPDRRHLLRQRVDAGRWRHPRSAQRTHSGSIVGPDHRARNLVALLLVRWWSFRWWIEDDAIWTSGGIFNKWRRRVTFGHIVTIDRSSTPVRRLFGASRVAMETTAVDQAAPDVLFGYLSNKNGRPPRRSADREARVRRQGGERGKTVRSAQRRPARVVGTDPCRSNDAPGRSRPGRSCPQQSSSFRSSWLPRLSSISR